MWWYFSTFSCTFKSEIFIWSRISLSYIKFNCTSYFIMINYFEFLTNSIRILSRNESTKIKTFFFIVKYIWLNLTCYITWTVHTRHYNLLFENLFKLVANNSRYTTFCNNFIQNASLLICGVSSCNIKRQFLFK